MLDRILSGNLMKQNIVLLEMLNIHLGSAYSIIIASVLIQILPVE